jgi:hypothetical protein
MTGNPEVIKIGLKTEPTPGDWANTEMQQDGYF